MTSMVSVRFKRDCRMEFMGTDMEEYGPFEVFDVVDLPRKNAEVLEDLGVVELVE